MAFRFFTAEKQTGFKENAQLITRVYQCLTMNRLTTNFKGHRAIVQY